MAWYAEARRRGADGQHETWMRLGSVPYKTRERAKAECKTQLEAEPNNKHRLEFRIVCDDERGTIEQVCQPPHAWRLKWFDARFVRD